MTPPLNDTECVTLKQPMPPIEHLEYTALYKSINLSLPLFGTDANKIVKISTRPTHQPQLPQATAFNPEENNASRGGLYSVAADLEKSLDKYIEFNSQSPKDSLDNKIKTPDSEIKAVEESLHRNKQLPQATAFNPEENYASRGGLYPVAADLEKSLDKYIEFNSQSPKDSLDNKIKTLDSEIKAVEESLHRKKKTAELTKEQINGEKENLVIETTKYYSLEHKIYIENRKTAEREHEVLEKLGPKIHEPLYNQPSDSEIYHENKRKYLSFKKVLVLHLKKKLKKKLAEEKCAVKAYLKQVRNWLIQVKKNESSEERKVKQAQYKQCFEEVFPELKQSGRGRKRNSRNTSRIKSKKLNASNMQEMRKRAMIVPLFLKGQQQQYIYKDYNGIVDDPVEDFRQKELHNAWTMEEVEIFQKKYLQYPKRFDVIASYLKNKSTRDCVKYYYLSKKQENYKLLLRNHRSCSKNSPQGKENNPINRRNTNVDKQSEVITGEGTKTARKNTYT